MSDEEDLRRDLRSAQAALGRTLTESEAREARAKLAVEGLTRRLEDALARAEELAAAQEVERGRFREERTRLTSTLEKAVVVHAQQRRELEEHQAGRDARAEELSRRLAASEAELDGARAGHESRTEVLARRLGVTEAELKAALAAAQQSRAEDLPGRLAASQTDLSRARAALAASAAHVASLEPAAAAAYERLRELSANVPLSDEERVSLRLAASAMADLSAAVGRLKRCLADVSAR